MKNLPLPARWVCLLLTTLLLASSSPSISPAADPAPPPSPGPTAIRQFAVKGVVKKVDSDNKRLIVAHEAIPNYMDAMTMPFRVKDPANLAAIHAGDSVSFTLTVTADQSWIDHIVRTGASTPAAPELSQPVRSPSPSASTSTTNAIANGAPHPHPPLLNYAFTNELGQPVRLADFRGQVLAMTFFFSRCPIPDYCPRLTKNFEEASRKLRDMPGAPTNYHFLSVTFDPEFDTPPRLKAYAENFGYDQAHWSFLTGPSNKVAELARLSDMKYQRDGAFFNHDLRTLIIDADGRLRMIFPLGGKLSDAIVQEMLKAAVPMTNTVIR